MSDLIALLGLPPEILGAIALFVMLVLLWDRLSIITNRKSTSTSAIRAALIEELRAENARLVAKLDVMERRLADVTSENANLRSELVRLRGSN